MKPYLTLVHVNLRLALRERIAIFFNYVFPMVFFFTFGGLMHAERGGVIAQVVTMVLVIGILGNGLFGGGIRAVQDREQTILRRYKVAPISPMPMLTASIVTGWALYLPAAIVWFLLAHFVYGMHLPERWLSIFLLVTAGVVAFRAVGLIIASVANSAQESQVLVQLVYLPMLFLSGTTFSLTAFPAWVQNIAQFLPATYLVTALQGTIVRNETAAQNWSAFAILLLTTAVSLFLSATLFRWEKEERLRPSGKLALVAVILPSIVFGAWQIRTQDQAAKAKTLYRQMQRSRTLLVRDARIVIGDGSVIESGSVLVQAGKIVEVYNGPAPAGLKADLVEAAGKTLLPGLIDARVQLTAPGGVYDPPSAFQPVAAAQRALAAYLYCGVTAVHSVGDPPAIVEPLVKSVVRGEFLGAEVLEVHGQAYIPMLAAIEAAQELQAGNPALLGRGLIQQVGPPQLIAGTRKVAEIAVKARSAEKSNGQPLRDAMTRLLEAYRSGATLVAGSGAGAPLVFHGPGIQREIELWVQAGVPARDALLAATSNAARLLGAEGRIGAIRKGHDADLVIVDGNPLEDADALERVATVIYKGERLDRAALLERE